MPTFTLAQIVRFITSAASLTLVLVGIALAARPATAFAAADDPPPCNTIQKALTTGTRFERDLLVERIHHDAKAVVDHCAENLLRSFGDPLRQHLAPPSTEARELEQSWLLELVRRMSAKRAGPWLKHLDTKTTEVEPLRSLLLTWAAEGTSATQTAVSLLVARRDRALTNSVLHALYPSLLELEGQSVTGATQVVDALTTLKFSVLMDDPEVGTVWALGNDYQDESIQKAELMMLDGKRLEAFDAYVAAASGNAHLLLLAGLYAEAFLLSKGDPKPFRKLNLPFRHCYGGGYEGEWKFGPLAKAAAKVPPGELHEEVKERRDRPACNRQNDDNLDEYVESVKKRPVGRLQSRASLRRRIALLEKMATIADELSSSGRQIQANEVRELIWREVEAPTQYRYLGGATAARGLQKRVRDWLPFPPEPKVSN